MVRSHSNYTQQLLNLTGLNNHTQALHGTTVNLTRLDVELNRFEADHNLTVVTEDEEGFQVWEDDLQLGQCREELLRTVSQGYCAVEFYMKMENVSQEKWCHLEEVIRPYHELTECLELLSNAVGCFYPNFIVQELFLQIHAHFFSTCSKDEPDFTDPPPALVLSLTLLPVALIPALVYLVIQKNQAQKLLN